MPKTNKNCGKGSMIIYQTNTGLSYRPRIILKYKEYSTITKDKDIADYHMKRLLEFRDGTNNLDDLTYRVYDRRTHESVIIEPVKKETDNGTDNLLHVIDKINRLNSKVMMIEDKLSLIDNKVKKVFDNFNNR